MFWVLIGLVLIFAAAMVFVAMPSTKRTVTREDFLDQLVKHTEGRKSELPGQPNSHRVDFDFEGYHFWYEDIESQGFTQMSYKGLLKIQSASDLNLIFLKKDRNKLLSNDIQLLSNINDTSINKHSKVFLPEELKEFDVFVQNPFKVNMFLEDKKAKAALLALKQVDRQGEAFMPVSISNGIVFLEFSADDRVKLNRQLLVEQMPILEKLVDHMITIVKALDKTNQAIMS